MNGVRVIVVEVERILVCTLNLHLFLGKRLNRQQRTIYIDGRRAHVDARKAASVHVQ